MKFNKFKAKKNNDINYAGNKKFMRNNFSFEIEKWKYNIRYDIYISSKGRIKDKEGNIIPPKTKNGYLWYQPAGKNAVALHRLILGTFKPVPDWEHLTVDHIDHNTRNNSIKNLEWVTEEENLRRAKEDSVIELPDTISPTTTISINKKIMPVSDALNYIPAITGVNKDNFKNEIIRILNKNDCIGAKWSGMMIEKVNGKV